MLAGLERVHGDEAVLAVGGAYVHDADRLVLEQLAVRVQQRLVGRGFDGARFVVELEQPQAPALAVDDAQLADDAAQQLRLASNVPVEILWET